MFKLDQHELRVLRKLTTPRKIQDFLDVLPINFELKGETLFSPRRVLREKTAHCMEGALFAALALRLKGHQPLIMDLKAIKDDDDHIIAPFRIKGKWGAISKTNHTVLRYREPVYRDIRELALSYFHEYFTHRGIKTLRSYSQPINLKRFDGPEAHSWMTDEKHLWYIDKFVSAVKHYPILEYNQIRTLRQADEIEIAAGKLVEWNTKGNRLFKKSKTR